MPLRLRTLAIRGATMAGGCDIPSQDIAAYMRAHTCARACMRACMYVRAHVCARACMRAHVCAHAGMFARMYVRACMRACMRAHVCTRVCMRAHMYACACVRACRYVRAHVCCAECLQETLGSTQWCATDFRGSPLECWRRLDLPLVQPRASDVRNERGSTWLDERMVGFFVLAQVVLAQSLC